MYEMVLYKVINLTQANIIIEDIGVHIPVSGHRFIDIHAYHGSRNLKDYISKKWVAVNEQRQKAPIPVWPLSKPKLKDNLPVQSDNALEYKLNEIISLLKSGFSGTDQRIASLPAFVRETVVTTPTSQNNSQSNPDFMFIPEKIVPDGVEAHMNLKTDESNREDFDNTQAALKNIRKSK